MPRCTVKLDDNKYIEWSTVVDAPVTYIQTREEHIEHLKAEYGRSYESEIPGRMERADKNGTSWQTSIPKSAKEYLSYNRAGPKESQISFKEIIERYENEEAYNKFKSKK